jgi:hypothetical protein
MEITESVPAQCVTLKLDFTKLMEANNTVVFTLEAQGAATGVTWAMTGPMNFLQNPLTIFFSMDRMVGRQFENGLASLKALPEST